MRSRRVFRAIVPFYIYIYILAGFSSVFNFSYYSRVYGVFAARTRLSAARRKVPGLTESFALCTELFGFFDNPIYPESARAAADEKINNCRKEKKRRGKSVLIVFAAKKES